MRRIVESEADAWELLQETWLETYRMLGSLRDPGTLPAFLYTTARNSALSRLQTPQVENEQYPDDVPDDRAADDCLAIDNVEQVHLPQREALTLFFCKT